MRASVPLIAILLVAAALPAWADVVIEESAASGSSQEAQKVMIYATDNRFAVQQGTAGLIFLADKQVLWQYDTAKAMYVEFTLATMKALRERADAVLGQEIKSIQQQMESMPPDQKAEMQKEIERMQRGAQYSYERLGSDRTVNGWKCAPVQILVDGQESEQICAAPLAELGLSPQDVKVLDALDRFYGNLGESASAEVFNLPDLEKFLGYLSFPVETTSSGTEGAIVTLLQSVKHEPVPEGVFVLPPGLKQESLFGFP